MKKIIPLFLCAFLVFLNSNAQDQQKLSGKVSDGKTPIENVSIQVDGKNTATTTDKEGRYQLVVETGDVVLYSYTGFKTVKIKIEDVTRILNPVMIPEVTELDEVTVQASKTRSQNDLEGDYHSDKNIFNTAYGYVDTKRLATNVRLIDEDLITPINTCILDLLKNKAGLTVVGNCNAQEGSVFTRSPRPAIFDVDGQIFEGVPFFLDTNTIKRIAILAGFIGTVKYGTLGYGGVIVINTIGNAPGIQPVVDRARVKNNNYSTDKVLTKEEVAQNSASYLKELKASGSLDAAKGVFESYETTYSGSPYFYLDAYDYFYNRRNDQEYADSILEENFALFEDNAVLLKALAYTYQEQGRLQKAEAILKEVFMLRPNYAQSYMDMANSYRDLGKPKQAASLYARYDYLLEEGFMENDTASFEKIIGREFNNLLLLKKRAVVEAKNFNKLSIAKDNFKGTRLVFEWNDGEADFELQFVNPENQYYTWKHSLFDNATEIEREKDFGYNVKEYLVDGSLPGTWKVNVNYLGNKSLTPTYLKATVYRNYGSPQQSKEVKVFKLFLKDANQKLFTLQSSGGVITN